YTGELPDYQREQVGRHLGRLGGRLIRSLDSINAHHARITAARLAELADDPAVQFVHPDRQVQASGTVTSTIGQPDYGWVTILNLPSSGYSVGETGVNIGVAIIDSGITANKDFFVSGSSVGRVVYNQSFIPGDTSTADAYGHGTHVAGIVGGNG